MVIDHIGIAVRNIHVGINHWIKVFKYQQASEIIESDNQMVRVVFMEKKDSLMIKLVEPTCCQSPIFNFARKGGGLHHLCFRCSDLDKELDRLKANRLRVLVPPEPGKAFDDENFAFVFANHGLNIQLIDTIKKAGLNTEKKTICKTV